MVKGRDPGLSEQLYRSVKRSPGAKRSLYHTSTL